MTTEENTEVEDEQRKNKEQERNGEIYKESSNIPEWIPVKDVDEGDWDF